ncbi:hypothetical protein ABK730_19080 [Klebsiella indica]|uniref:hypothetical protein n=1 Tax=Klebsiella TaxID=570 RepID=UPI0037539D21
MKRKPRRTNDTGAQQLEKLEEINARLKNIETSFDDLQKVAARNGAVAGAVSGGLCGGLIATGIALIKVRMGF